MNLECRQQRAAYASPGHSRTAMQAPSWGRAASLEVWGRLILSHKGIVKACRLPRMMKMSKHPRTRGLVGSPMAPGRAGASISLRQPTACGRVVPRKLGVRRLAGHSVPGAAIRSARTFPTVRARGAQVGPVTTDWYGGPASQNSRSRVRISAARGCS
jgi:hypothetical protein